MSVIIPAHNASGTVGACLDSVLRQDDPNYEVILVDDGSTDATASIARRFTQVKLVQLGSRQRQPRARNRGAREASGKILIFSDADVTFAPGWLSRKRHLLDDPGTVAVTGGYADAPGPTFLQRFQLRSARERCRNLGKGIDTTITVNLAVKRSVFDEVGGFDPGLYPTEDLEFGWSVARRWPGGIRWDAQDGVAHVFRSRWRDFVVREFFNAAGVTRSLLRDPARLSMTAHFRLSNTLEDLALTAALWVFMVLGIFYPIVWACSLGALAAMAAFHTGLLRRLWKDHPLDPIKGVAALVVRNSAWGCGVCLGALRAITQHSPRTGVQPPSLQ